MNEKELNGVVNEYLYNNYFDDFKIVFKPDKGTEDSFRNKIHRLKIKLEEARLLKEDFNPVLDEAEEEFGFFVEANADGFKKPLRDKTIQRFSDKFKTFIGAVNGK